MTLVAPLLQAFFIERLATERRASPHTISAYKTTFSLLLRFAHDLSLSTQTAGLAGRTDHG